MTLVKLEKGETMIGRSTSTMARLRSSKCPRMGDSVSGEEEEEVEEGKRVKRRSQIRTRSGRENEVEKIVERYLNT